MILEGRSLKIGDALDAIKPDVKRRRKLTCHICSRDYFQLSTHLARVHKLSPELRRYHVESSKKNVTLKETNVRKNIIDKISLLLYSLSLSLSIDRSNQRYLYITIQNGLIHNNNHN